MRLFTCTITFFIAASAIPLIALSDSITIPNAQEFNQSIPQINPAPTMTQPTTGHESPSTPTSQAVTQQAPAQYYAPLPSTNSPTATPTAPAPAIAAPKGNNATQATPSAGYNSGILLNGGSSGQTDSQAKEFIIY